MSLSSRFSLSLLAALAVWSAARADPAVSMTLPPKIRKLHINIGTNLSPLKPPLNDAAVGVLAVEANTGIAHHLREHYQKRQFPHRFFVLTCAVSGASAAGSVATFHYYNAAGMSSSLSSVGNPSGRADAKVPGWADAKNFDPRDTFGPGPAGFDLVPVLSLEALLSSVPSNVSIPLLKTDVQGHDFVVIKSATPASLRRVREIVSETYLAGVGEKYEGVRNRLDEWIPYMRSMGFRLANPPKPGTTGEYDATWIRIGV